MNYFYKNKEKGFSAIEAVISIIIALIVVVAFTTLISRIMMVNSINEKELKAVFYLQEIVEIAKDIEQSDWETLEGCLSPNFCSPRVDGGSWVLVDEKETLEDNYLRWLTVENVYRDENNEITLSCEGCELDENTKKIVAKIDWDDRLNSRSLEIKAYLYNYNQ